MKREFFRSIFESGMWTQEISRSLAFLIIGILSIGLSWYAMTASENMAKNFENSSAVHIELRSDYTQ